jgi:uncharacterized membrane protein YfcA
MLADPVFYLTAVPAVIVVGLGKGGFSGLGAIGMPLMALGMAPVRAAAVMLPILIVQDLFSVWVYRRAWDRTNLRFLLPGACLGILLGYLLAARVPDALVALVVGTIAVLFALRRWLRLGPPAPAQPVPARRVPGWFWGSLAGFTSMIAHAGGPPFQIYVLPQRLPRDVFVGTGVVFFALVNWVKVPPYLMLGQFTGDNLLVSVSLFPLAIASTWAGVWLVRRFHTDRFYDVAFAFLLLIGLKLVWEGLSWLFG